MKKLIALTLILAMLCVFSLVGCGKKDTYEVRITVPAGSTEEFVYSDEEISATGNKITISTGDGLGDTEVTQNIYTKVEKIQICIGESKFSFEKPEDIKNICNLFKNIVGEKVSTEDTQLEGFYEIIFLDAEKETRVILTGPTIFIDGIEYYTNKDIIEPLCEYLE